MKYQRTSILFTISILFSGCTLTSGLQTYDLPPQGNYRTDQGAELSVIQITQDNIPRIELNNAQNSNTIFHLFNKHQQVYKLSSGDVLSIQLWAYPEITPPIQDISNVKAAGYPIDSSGNIQFAQVMEPCYFGLLVLNAFLGIIYL